MLKMETEHEAGHKVVLPAGEAAKDQGPKVKLTHSYILRSYRVAEFATLARDGSPVCWPLAPDLKDGYLIFSTGYMYPAKARNAQRNPRVAALFSDPTASGRSDNDPEVLVQGLAEVFDRDLQRNTERYVDQLLQKGPLLFRLMVRTPGIRQLFVGYLARIWIEVTPLHEQAWARGQLPAGPSGIASRPDSFSPGPGIELPQEVIEWLHRYPRPPVLAYIDPDGWPVITRVQATLMRDHIVYEPSIVTNEGAPACLTYHRLIGNYLANDSFLIRGHFDNAGRIVPEKIVGFGGSQDDRGLGSVKMLRTLLGLRKQLSQQLKKEARPLPVVHPTCRP